MKRLLRGVTKISGTISDAHLAVNFRNLTNGLANGLVWERPEDVHIWSAIKAHVDEHDEQPSLETLLEKLAPDPANVQTMEVRERLKDIAATDACYSSNYKALVGLLRENCFKIAFVAALKEGHEVFKKRGHEEALRHILPRLESLKNSATPKTKALTFVSGADLAEPLPPVEWLCEGLRLAPGGVAMFAGFGFSGKTLLAQYIALCVVFNLPIFGIYPVRQGTVAHLDYEQGMRLTKRRYQRLAAAMGVSLAEAGDRLRLSVYPDHYMDADGAEEIYEATFEGCALGIVDSYKAACPNTEENASSARIPLDMLARISERTGTVPLVIDHARKPKEEASAAKFSIRGNGAKFDALTTAYVFQAEKGKPTRVSHEKCRHRGNELPDFGFRVVNTDDDPDGPLKIEHLDEQAMAEAATTAPPDRVLSTKITSYLSTLPHNTFNGSRSKLIEEVGGNKGAMLETISQLIRCGQIVTGGKSLTFVPARAANTNGVGGHALHVDDEASDALKRLMESV